MPRHSYHQRDYTFGQTMLTLRISLGLTLPVQLSPHAEMPVAPAVVAYMRMAARSRLGSGGEENGVVK